MRTVNFDEATLVVAFASNSASMIAPPLTCAWSLDTVPTMLRQCFLRCLLSVASSPAT